MLDKLSALERKMSMEKGDFNLFALFFREEGDSWDLVVAAKWFEDDWHQALTYLSDNVSSSFTTEEMLQLTGTIMIEQDNPELPKVLQFVQVEHGLVYLRDRHLFNMDIKHMFFFTSKDKKIKEWTGPIHAKTSSMDYLYMVV